MIQSVKALKDLIHRAIFVLVLAAFLAPAPVPTPQDELRALYASQGMMCDTDTPSHQHREAHCLLCLLPATGAASAAVVIDAPGPVLLVRTVAQSALPSIRPLDKARHARAPPASIV